MFTNHNSQARKIINKIKSSLKKGGKKEAAIALASLEHLDIDQVAWNYRSQLNELETKAFKLIRGGQDGR